jgi:hypothetical protein
MTEAEARRVMWEARPKGRTLSTAPEPAKAADSGVSSFKKIAITIVGGVAAAYSIKYLKQWGLL